MSTGSLNVWVTGRSDACHIDDGRQWYIHITDCEGRPLKWCRRTYTFLPAKCGHLEVSIPPGCYTVFASLTARKDVKPPFQPFGNHLTHVQVVRVNCGDHVCVTLFQPSAHYCGTWFALAMTDNLPVLEQAKFDTKLAQTAITAVQQLVAKMDPDPYTENVRRLIDEGPPREETK
jgi:hypothetical protein